MKVFICADIEGTAGIVDWEETIRGERGWEEFRELMTLEVLAACEGARAAGATEVVVKDAHDSGRNILVGRLPDYVRVVRSWSGHPDQMMFGIDETFDAAVFTGHHSRAGTEDNPLAHTSNQKISCMYLNGKPASEFTINALCAARYGVPSVFLSGDEGICAEVAGEVPGIVTVETLKGYGNGSNSIAPQRAQKLIREGVERALRQDNKTRMPDVKGPFEVKIEFTNPVTAYQSSWYPGVKTTGPRTITYAADDFFEILRALRFIKG